MKTIRIICIALTATLLVIGCQKKGNFTIDTEAPAALKNNNDSISWALGTITAQNIIATGIEVDREVLIQALLTTLDNKTQPLTQEQLMQLQQQIEKQLYVSEQAKYQSSLEEARASEKTYFAQLLQNNPNVKKSDKGFYYEVLKEGTGRKAEPGLIIDFDYKGTFTNGQIFDQTYGNRSSIVHLVDESLMPGLREGFCMMKAGSTYRFYFPCEMAFGAKGTDDIPPFTTVIYEVELHDVHE